MTDPDAPTPPEQPDQPHQPHQPWAPPTVPPAAPATPPPPPPYSTGPAPSGYPGPYGAQPPSYGYGAYPGYPGHPGQPGHPGPPAPPYSYPPQRPTPAAAVWALVLGIASIVCCGLIAGIPAIILGRSAMKEVDRSGGTKGGRGLAQAGFITGIVGTALSVVGIIFLVIALALGTTTMGPTQRTTCNLGPDGLRHCTRT